MSSFTLANKFLKTPPPLSLTLAPNPQWRNMPKEKQHCNECPWGTSYRKCLRDMRCTNHRSPGRILQETKTEVWYVTSSSALLPGMRSGMTCAFLAACRVVLTELLLLATTSFCAALADEKGFASGWGGISLSPSFASGRFFPSP